MGTNINDAHPPDHRSGISFLLKTEMRDKKKGMCLHCNTTMTKKMEINENFIVYRCWNKKCPKKGVSFAVINKHLFNEYKFNAFCLACNKPMMRDLVVEKDGTAYLFFRCNSKFCERSIEPYIYNLTLERWEGTIPIFESDKSKFLWTPKRIELVTKKIEPWKPKSICKIGKVPILDLTEDKYTEFINHHNNKVAVLVDVPNWVRTIDTYMQGNINEALHKTENFVKCVIAEKIDKDAECIVRYFSVPENDLMWANHVFSQRCKNHINKEFFHLLEIEKYTNNEAGFSDIDNYLIVNAMTLIESCELKGLVIVSSDKDYLPVMLSAKRKNIHTCVLGVKIPKIYSDHGIDTAWYIDVVNRPTNSSIL